MKIKSPLTYYPFSLIQGVQGFLQSSVFIWSVSSCIGNIFLISRIIKIEACFTGENRVQYVSRECMTMYKGIFDTQDQWLKNYSKPLLK